MVCVRCVDDLDIPIPAIVDKIDDRANMAYAAHPDRLFLVGKDGKIAYAGERGPRGFLPHELEEAIRRELSLEPSSDSDEHRRDQAPPKRRPVREI